MRSHMLEATSGFPQSAAVSFDLRVRQLWLRRGSSRALLCLRRETVVHVFARFSVELDVVMPVLQQQQRDGEVVLLSEDRHLAHGFGEALRVEADTRNAPSANP